MATDDWYPVQPDDDDYDRVDTRSGRRTRGGERGRALRVRQEQVFVRRRRAVLAGLAAVVLVLVAVVGVWVLDRPGAADDAKAAVAGAGDPTGKAAGGTGAAGTSEQATEEDEDAEEKDEEPAPDPLWQKEPVPVERPSDTTALEQVDYLTGGLTPKSVMASGHGLMILNNMMYSHTSTVYDSTTREQVAVLDDSLDLAEFGVEGHPGVSQGSPVEAVWTEDGRYAYVSQYTMYGQNFGVEGFDACTKDSGVGASMVYRFDAEELAWDQAIRVGGVPKYLEITPDQSTILVSNWCDATLSVVDVEQAKEVKVIDVNAAPRGIAIMPDSNTAYAVAMYAEELYEIDIEAGTSEVVMNTALRPRHLNVTEDGRWLYLTASAGNAIFKIDTETMEVVDQVTPGMEPRSVTLSPDETALYVVNYNEASVSKIRTSDMELIDKKPVDADPIGIDYDPVTNTVWVACYNGAVYVFDDQSTPLP